MGNKGIYFRGSSKNAGNRISKVMFGTGNTENQYTCTLIMGNRRLSDIFIGDKGGASTPTTTLIRLCVFPSCLAPDARMSQMSWAFLSIHMYINYGEQEIKRYI